MTFSQMNSEKGRQPQQPRQGSLSDRDVRLALAIIAARVSDLTRPEIRALLVALRLADGAGRFSIANADLTNAIGTTSQRHAARAFAGLRRKGFVENLTDEAGGVPPASRDVRGRLPGF